MKKKIDWTKNYTSTPITIEKGQIIKLLTTNLAYIEPPKVLINNYPFLFFNGINAFYINTLHVEHNLTEPEKYFRIAKYS